MNKQIDSEANTMLEQMAKELSHLEIQNVNSSILQQFALSSPYMIFLETCNEKSDTYHTWQITSSGCILSQFDKTKQRQLRNRPQHKHSFIEIMYVLSGSVTNRIENQAFTYTKGQCCVMNSNICHCELFEGNFQVVFFMFQNEFLQTILREYMEERKITVESLKNRPLFQLFHDTITAAHHLDKIYLDCLPHIPAAEALDQLIPLFNNIILEIIDQKPGFTFHVKGAFTGIFHLLSTPSLYSVEKIHSEASQHEYLTAKIIHILEANHGHCTRQQLTDQLHYTGEYLNRILKKYTGKTISEYRQHIFLQESARLLSDTDMSISDIISELGLSNRNYFYRLFEQNYGLTPLAFRERHSATSESPL